MTAILLLGISALLAAPGDIHLACDQGDLTRVKRILGEDPKLANERHPEGATPLYLAARGGFPEIVQLLLDAKADPNAVVSGRTALHAAAGNGSKKVINQLLVAGAKIDPLD